MLAFGPVHSAQSGAIDLAYQDFFSIYTQDKWVEANDKELPSGFSDAYSLIRKISWISGMRLKDSNTLVIFEFEKPRLSSMGFCRSRLNIHILYEYDTEKSYRELPKTSLLNFKEFVQFPESNSFSECVADDLDSLDDFVIIESPMRDDEVLRLWKVFEQKKRCFKDGNVILEKIGVSPYANQARDNEYYLQIKTTKGSKIVELDADQTTVNTQCTKP